MARGAGRLRAAPMLAAGLWLAVAGLAAHAAARAPARLVVNVDLHQTARPISKYEYGMFIENLGQLVHVSLWSQ
ncbi:MAG: hypothetical protein ACYCUE_03250, partial [Steroidobacteraceae bacterium]